MVQSHFFDELPLQSRQALQRIFDRGKEKAHESASRTLAEVRRVIGYRD